MRGLRDLGKLKAGFSKVDITPPVGVYLSGYILRGEPSQGVHDNLHARALVLDDGKTRVTVVSADLTGLFMESIDRIRSKASELTGIGRENILIACTHTHSGPATFFMRGVEEVDGEYLALLERKIVDSIVQANNGLRESSLAVGSGLVRGVGYNRERRSREPVDEELGVIRVNSLKGDGGCLILNYACHPVVLGPSNLFISADYPGAVERFVERSLGLYCLFTCGACGDIDPITNLEVWGKGTFGDVERLGRLIGAEAVKVAEGLDGTTNVKMGTKTASIELPVREPPSVDEAKKELSAWRERLEELRRSGASTGELRIAKAMIGWAEDVLRSLTNRSFPKSKRIEVMLIGLNDTLLVAIPGEPFVEVGLKIKEASPFRYTYVIGYGNGEVGYFPTAEAFNRGGYEVEMAPRYLDITFLKPESEAILESSVIDLAERLHRELESP
ncbi:hypothetical protein DRO55_02020 [Candidatus Bathyarchaeota archaeon]|nr:MAG: hypothetical protein DRO55_02020 [Candidatus Bathyarchaeota archaeon]